VNVGKPCSYKGLESAKEGLENYTWWDNADKLKQNCFYLDYKAEIIFDPAISTKQWTTAHQFVGASSLI